MFSKPKSLTFPLRDPNKPTLVALLVIFKFLIVKPFPIKLPSRFEIGVNIMPDISIFLDKTNVQFEV